MKRLLFLFVAVVLFACNDSQTIEGSDTDTDVELPYRVLEYRPAPGQFINDTKVAGFDGSETTPAAAVEYARRRLAHGMFVSLGGFGGYIVVGFDESIENNGADGDFTIEGNQHAGSSEPGVVWVMQDANGDGKPNETWYELRGSETGAEGTIQNYSVTYFRPSAAKSATTWEDNLEQTGSIKWLEAFHPQDYYYPAWIEEDSYTLSGTRLMAHNYLDEGRKEWVNPPYDRGYADNLGDDRLTGTDARKVRFKISNAMLPEGMPALPRIDFIKVQCAVNAESGWTGELSTEVVSFEDI